MFNSPSDPWYTYMQPFRIVLLKKMIKAQQQAQRQAQQQVAQEETKKDEIISP